MAFRRLKKFSDRFSRFDTIPECDRHPASHVAVTITLNAQASSLKTVTLTLSHPTGVSATRAGPARLYGRDDALSTLTRQGRLPAAQRGQTCHNVSKYVSKDAILTRARKLAVKPA